MASVHQKEEFYAHSSLIPYSVFYDALRIGHQLCVQKKKEVPNKYILYLSPIDRAARKKYEHIFIDEMIHDLMLLAASSHQSGAPQLDVQFEVRTEKMFDSGRIRLEFNRDEVSLFQLEQELEPMIRDEFDSPLSEWNAMDMMPEKNVLDKNILVVDDETVLCVVLGKMLRKLGYNAICAYNGVDAVKIMEHMNFDLVISDLRMPQMDGWALMKYVKTESPSVPVVLITGYHSLYTAQKSKHRSADGYISKPFSMDQIRMICEKLLSEKEECSSVRHSSSEG